MENPDSTQGLYGLDSESILEVMSTPKITTIPGMPPAMDGIVNIRGAMVPVLNLPKYANLKTKKTPEMMIVVQVQKQMQGLLVDQVENFFQLDSTQWKEPPSFLQQYTKGWIHGMVDLRNGQLVTVLDVENLWMQCASPLSKPTTS